MKTLLIFLMALVPILNQAQQQPRLRYSKVKKAGYKQTTRTPLENSKPSEKISIGDTCYVITASIAIRGLPITTNASRVYLGHNAKLVVREIPNAQWLLIDHFDLDVGVEGYVPRQAVSLKKAD